MKKKILVTGALGFVGSSICESFSLNGYDVIGIDNRSKLIGSDINYKLITKSGSIFYYCDISNQSQVDGIFNKFGEFDFIFHMASQVSFKKSIESPRNDFEINLLGTFNLLENLRTRNSNSLFVYASTNQVYGAVENIPLVETETRYDFKELKKGISEQFPLDFLSPYGCSKGGGEIYSIDYARVYGIKSCIVRFGGIYGKNQYSTEDHGWVSYITNMIRLNQSYNRFGHGKQIRDILYIDDIISAMYKITLNNNLISGDIFNIAGGPDNTLSVLELIKLVENITGNKSKDKILDMRKADKVVMYLDISKAKKELDWEPKVGIYEGLEKLIKWQNSI